MYSVLVHMIYTYAQRTVLATKSSHTKVPSEVSLIDCLAFLSNRKQYEYGAHTEKTIH